MSRYKQQLCVVLTSHLTTHIIIQASANKPVPKPEPFCFSSFKMNKRTHSMKIDGVVSMNDRSRSVDSIAKSAGLLGDDSMVTSPTQITKDKLTKDHLDEDCLQNWPFLNSMASKSTMKQFDTFWQCSNPVNTRGGRWRCHGGEFAFSILHVP